MVLQRQIVDLRISTKRKRELIVGHYATLTLLQLKLELTQNELKLGKLSIQVKIQIYCW